MAQILSFSAAVDARRETILAIEEVTNVRDPKEPTKERWPSTYDGFMVKTNKQEIFLLIGNEQDCCERWGYFMSHDDVQSFIGADLLEVKLVDDKLNVVKLDADGDVDDDGYHDERMTMFVNLETSRGTLQFTAYNEHNGYYSHLALVRSIQLDEEQRL